MSTFATPTSRRASQLPRRTPRLSRGVSRVTSPTYSQHDDSMDVDFHIERMTSRRDSIVFAKNDEMLVLFHSQVPLEVQQIFKTAG